MIARHATRASHLPDHLHAAPPLTREEAKTLGWEHAAKARRRRIAASLLVIGGALAAALYVAVWM
jgi:hypothetical protein